MRVDYKNLKIKHPPSVVKIINQKTGKIKVIGGLTPQNKERDESKGNN